MTLVTMPQLLDEAARDNYGVGAFNVNNLEQVQAIMEVARETEAPVTIQASRGARMEAFGQAGHAKDYAPISLPDMADCFKEQGHQLTTASRKGI